MAHHFLSYLLILRGSVAAAEEVLVAGNFQNSRAVTNCWGFFNISQYQIADDGEQQEKAERVPQ